MTVQYNTATESLSELGFGPEFEEPDGSPKAAVQTASVFYQPLTGAVRFVNSKGLTLYELLETGKGSDGMSDRMFPYDVWARSSQYLPKDYMGGCYSSTKPATEAPEEPTAPDAK